MLKCMQVVRGEGKEVEGKAGGRWKAGERKKKKKEDDLPDTINPYFKTIEHVHADEHVKDHSSMVLPAFCHALFDGGHFYFLKKILNFLGFL